MLRALSEASIKKGTRVIVRGDFDLATHNGKIEDASRLMANIPTIEYIMKRGGYVRIISHFGRPHGVREPDLSMRAIASRLGRILKKKVVFITDPLDEKMFEKYNTSSDILFFENIRFYPDEEKNSKAFAKKLSRWGDMYVNEAFANCHRVHASMVALAQCMPAYAGLHLQEEFSFLHRVLTDPPQPLVAIIGGAKLETKLPLVKAFLARGHQVLVGSGLATTFFSATTHMSSFNILSKKKNIILPSDVCVVDHSGTLRTCAANDIRKNEEVVDIGPESIKRFSQLIVHAKTVVWNGPLGIAEEKKYAKGTIQIAQSIQSHKALTIIGGGDTVAILQKWKLLHGFTHVSTGGGAMLEFLSGKKMPALDILKRS